MARGRTNRRGRRQRRNIRRRRGAGAQSRQILRLDRQVRQLRRDVTSHAQWTMPLEGQASATDPNAIVLNDNEFTVSSLIRPASWNPLFQTTVLTGAPVGQDNGTFTAQKVRVNSMSFSIVMSPEDSLLPLAPRMINFYILKLKNETASDVLQKTDGMSTAGLNAAANANDNIVFRQRLAGGYSTLIRWNPAAFQIVYQKTLKLANILQETIVPEEDTALTNTHDALRRFHFRVKMGNLVTPATGTWKQMNELDIFPNDRYYMVVHVGGFGGGIANANAVEMSTLTVVNTTLYQ